MAIFASSWLLLTTLGGEARLWNCTDIFMFWGKKMSVKFSGFVVLYLCFQQITYKLGKCTDFKVSFPSLLTNFRLLVLVKSWKIKLWKDLYTCNDEFIYVVNLVSKPTNLMALKLLAESPQSLSVVTELRVETGNVIQLITNGNK